MIVKVEKPQLDWKFEAVADRKCSWMIKKKTEVFVSTKVLPSCEDEVKLVLILKYLEVLGSIEEKKSHDKQTEISLPATGEAAKHK